jgi:hypothetical protein
VRSTRIGSSLAALHAGKPQSNGGEHHTVTDHEANNVARSCVKSHTGGRFHARDSLRKTTLPHLVTQEVEGSRRSFPPFIISYMEAIAHQNIPTAVFSTQFGETIHRT